MLEFRSAGESHGAGICAFVEGLPKGLRFDEDWVDAQLARRQRGYGRSARQAIERDRVEVLGGVRRGLCLEAPLCLLVRNRDQSLEVLGEPTRPRPGHADLAGCLRHGDRDIRANIERASARETVARVAAGAVAQLLLREIDVEVLGRVTGVGEVCAAAGASRLATLAELEAARRIVARSELGMLDPVAERLARDRVDAAREVGDTVGGRIEVVAAGLPPGLGSFSQWDRRLDGRLAHALCSIPAIKALGFGFGEELSRVPGSEAQDPIERGDAGRLRRASNRAGGLEGGVTNGEPLVVRLAMKPISTLRRPLASVDLESGAVTEAGFERSDVCAVPAAAVVAEAMCALVLARACLELFGGASLAAFAEGAAGHARRAAAVLGGSEAGP